MKNRYLQVESPDKATVDFLSEGVSVDIAIVDGKLTIKARLSHGEEASTFDVHEAEWPLPEKS